MNLSDNRHNENEWILHHLRLADNYVHELHGECCPHLCVDNVSAAVQSGLNPEIAEQGWSSQGTTVDTWWYQQSRGEQNSCEINIYILIILIPIADFFQSYLPYVNLPPSKAAHTIMIIIYKPNSSSVNPLYFLMYNFFKYIFGFIPNFYCYYFKSLVNHWAS